MTKLLVNYFFSGTLFIAGIIHLIPARVLFDSELIKQIYNVEKIDDSIKLLLVHRAVFFLLIGLLLLYAAIQPNARIYGFVIGEISMLSYILLYLILKPENPALLKIFRIDLILFLLLGMAYIIDFLYYLRR